MQDQRQGSIRVVNYVAGVDDEGRPVLMHRIEQLWDGHWTPVPVYHETGDGLLQEIKQ
jgi:hypothetical protein